MKKLALWLSAVAVLATASGGSRADFVLLALSTEPETNPLPPPTTPETVDLPLGQPVTFYVNLYGIDPNTSSTYLSFLYAIINYDNNLLSSNPSVKPGAIIPDTSDYPSIFSFNGGGDPTDAYGFYEGHYSNPDVIIPITQSGVFFSFQLTPNQTGSGTLSFTDPFGTTDAAYTLANDTNQTDQPTPTTFDLNFTIEAGTAVPEPSTFVLLISSIFGLSAGAGLRGLARRVRRGK